MPDQPAFFLRHPLPALGVLFQLGDRNGALDLRKLRSRLCDLESVA